MCGIAGVIHRNGPGDIGSEMTRMLQSMKHRGPDSSGFALYGPPDDELFVMRIKLADPNEAAIRLGRAAGAPPQRARGTARQAGRHDGRRSR